MTATSLNDGFGALRFPVATAVEGIELDPGQASLLGLIKAAILAELGDTWTSLLATVDNAHPLNAKGNGTPVGTASLLEVTPQQMTQLLSSWPLLAVYRQGEPEFSQHTLGGYDVMRQEWSVDYVLGPLVAAHIIKLGPFCVAVRNVIKTVLMHGYHPTFRNGARQFFGEFVEVKVKSVQGPGLSASLGEEQGAGYYGLTVVVETTERTVLDGYAATGEFETDTGYVPVGTGTADLMDDVVNTITFDNQTE